MNTTTLKLLALVLMLVDHIGQFIPDTPIWFGWIGRISAPLFIFAIVLGFTYTSDPKKYIIRLYLLNLVVTFMNLTINLIYNLPLNSLTNNFITPLFLIVVLLYIIQKGELKLYMVFGIWQVVSILLIILIAVVSDITGFPYPNLLADPDATLRFFSSLLGNMFFNEGGILFILLGIGLYLTKGNKLQLVVCYSGFSVMMYVIARKFGYNQGVIDHLFPFPNYQWMMIAALPFMLIYNGKKGIGLKYLFYIFYPLHIAILYIIGQ